MLNNNGFGNKTVINSKAVGAVSLLVSQSFLLDFRSVLNR